MKRVTEKIDIQAPVETVWDCVFLPHNFTKWTEVFTKGSYYEGSWEEGASIRFLARNKDGQIDGMVSEIAKNVQHEFLSIRHLGWVFDGEDDTMSEAVTAWAPAYENYHFESTKEGGTILTVEADLSSEYYEQFAVLWPKAIKRIKEISEGG